jgi:hypothetical protein
MELLPVTGHVLVCVRSVLGGFALRRIARRSCCCLLKALRTQPINHCTQTLFACISLFVLFDYCFEFEGSAYRT